MTITASSLATTGADVLLVISNLAFLAPSILAYSLHLFTYGSVYLLIIFFSGSYHLCNSFSAACLFDATIHKEADFFFAQLVIPMSSLYLIYFPRRLAWIQRIALIGFAVLLFILEITIGIGFGVQVSLTILSFVILVGYWIGFAIRQKSLTGRASIPFYRWGYLALGIALTTQAVTLFATQSGWPAGYWAIHSHWHVLGAIGQFFILLAKVPYAPRYAVMDGKIKS